MQSSTSGKTCTDIAATVKEHTAIVPSLLAMHCLSGCDTVGQLYGIGKGKALKVLRSGCFLWKLGCTDEPISDVILEVTRFMAACFGSKKDDMSDVRVEMWAKTMSKHRVMSAPELKSLPPTSEGFSENVKRAHIQAAIWRSAVSSHPPEMDPVQFGWKKDASSRILIPVTTPEDVPLASLSVLEMISCKWASKQPCHVEMHNVDVFLLVSPALSFAHAVLIFMPASTYSTRTQLKVMEMRMMRVISITVE